MALSPMTASTALSVVEDAAAMPLSPVGGAVPASLSNMYALDQSAIKLVLQDDRPGAAERCGRYCFCQAVGGTGSMFSLF